MSELTIAFDADDTLWHNEHAFAETEARFVDLVAPWADETTAYAALVACERHRVEFYGFGVKSFALSMIDTACELSDNQMPTASLRTIVGWADALLQMPTVMIDGAAETLARVSAVHRVMIITKGDLHHQMRRIDETRVADSCFDVEVVAEKDVATYDRVLTRHAIDRSRFVMVGNSMVSDVVPLLALGCRAVHIPYEVTFALEVAEADPPPSDLWYRLDTIRELPPLLEKLR